MECSNQLSFALLIGTLHLSRPENILTIALINIHYLYNKQLLNEVFVICRIINVEARVISRAEGKTESNNRFIIHFKRKNPKKRDAII